MRQLPQSTCYETSQPNKKLREYLPLFKNDKYPPPPPNYSKWVKFLFHLVVTETTSREWAIPIKY